MIDECPYCNTEIEINHDDGVGFDEDILHQQQCHNCEKTFVYRTSIIMYYDLMKADCLNGGDHNWKRSITFPKEYTKMICNDCGERRGLTKTEREKLMDEVA